MSSTNLRKTIAARARAHTQMLSMAGHRGAVRDRAGTSLERRIERVRSAARSAGQTGARSRIGSQVPKT